MEKLYLGGVTPDTVSAKGHVLPLFGPSSFIYSKMSMFGAKKEHFEWFKRMNTIYTAQNN